MPDRARPQNWLCLVAGVLLALMAPAAAQCNPKYNKLCKNITYGAGATCVWSTPVWGGSAGRFASSDFAGSCLGDASKDCAHPKNAPQEGHVDNSCCSCFLYAKYCFPNKGKNRYSTHGALGGDFLLMPTAACTGVENWNNPGGHTGCVYEDIWDEGRTILKNAGKGAGWGMAINPVSKRGQHQMHVHLAEMYGDLEKAIEDGYTAFNGKTVYITCAGSGVDKRRVEQCSKPTTSGNANNDIRIQYVKTSSGNPSDAKPFSTAYGTDVSRNNNLLLNAAAVVAPVHGHQFKVWAIVTNPIGQAECHFKSTEDKCQK